MSESLKKKVLFFYNKWRRELDELYFKSKTEKKQFNKNEDN